MILQRLVEYYDRVANDPQCADSLPKPGYSLQKISFCVVLEPDGRLQQFQSLLITSEKIARSWPGEAGGFWDQSLFPLGQRGIHARL